MIGLRMKFDLGRYHANPWGAHVNDAAVEWPPSPWRLLRALYSAGRTHTGVARLQPDLDRALARLASAAPPVFELPPAIAAHTRHFMPVPEGRGEKAAKVFDGFLAVDPEAEAIAWWDARLDASACDALAAAARAIGYLGRSESICTAELATGPGPDEPSAQPIAAFAGGAQDLDLIDLLDVNSSDPLTTLSASVGEIRRQRHAQPPGTLSVTYGVRRLEVSSRRAAHPAPHRPELALFRVQGGGRPPLSEAVTAGHLLRSALQSRYGVANGKAVSATFSGRAGDRQREDQHRHAHFLSLADRYGRRIDRLVVWAPEGFGGTEVAALSAVQRLWKRDGDSFDELQLTLGALGEVDDLRLPALLGPAREWTSLTPFGLVRHPKMKGGKPVDSPGEQVERELLHRGLPAPAEIEIDSGAGWHRFRSSKPGTSRLGKAPLVGVTIRFDKEVVGPLALGALSHYGLGLMRPLGPT